MSATESGERSKVTLSKNTTLTAGLVVLIVGIACVIKGQMDNNEVLTKIVQDHEVRIRTLEAHKP